MIVYEYPLNERIRTWLRLEYLFDKAAFFIESDEQHSHHAALLAIFELADVMARSELRSELIQELERKKASLEPLKGNPEVDGERLEAVLASLSATLAELHDQVGKLGQHIRDNNWLAGIKSRTGIPGGACAFDLPGYHFWLNRSAPRRREDLDAWLGPMLPIKSGVRVILKLLREGGTSGHYVAEGGLFQLMLGGRVAQLLQVVVAADMPCVPEVSANKYAVNLRFMTVGTSQKARICDQEIPFELVLCSLASGI